MKKIYRHKELHNPNGIFGIGKSNYFNNWLERPGQPDEFIPGTRVKRLRTIKIGVQARGIPESEVERVVAGLWRESEQGR